MAKPTHAAIPGTGPAGETCLSCGHGTLVEDVNKPFPVCGKVAEMTGTRPSRCGKILRTDPACRYWKQRAGS